MSKHDCVECKHCIASYIGANEFTYDCKLYSRNTEYGKYYIPCNIVRECQKDMDYCENYKKEFDIVDKINKVIKFIKNFFNIR